MRGILELRTLTLSLGTDAGAAAIVEMVTRYRRLARHHLQQVERACLVSEINDDLQHCDQRISRFDQLFRSHDLLSTCE